jgi:hypothetical protein
VPSSWRMASPAGAAGVGAKLRSRWGLSPQEPRPACLSGLPSKRGRGGRLSPSRDSGRGRRSSSERKRGRSLGACSRKPLRPSRGASDRGAELPPQEPRPACLSGLPSKRGRGGRLSPSRDSGRGRRSSSERKRGRSLGACSRKPLRPSRGASDRGPELLPQEPRPACLSGLPSKRGRGGRLSPSRKGGRRSSSERKRGRSLGACSRKPLRPSRGASDRGPELFPQEPRPACLSGLPSKRGRGGRLSPSRDSGRGRRSSSERKRGRSLGACSRKPLRPSRGASDRGPELLPQEPRSACLSGLPSKR